MAILYYCRHCGSKVGTLEQTMYDAEQLGFDKLSEEERNEMISYDAKGDIYVKCICDHCYDSFLTNPNNFESDYIIH